MYNELRRKNNQRLKIAIRKVKKEQEKSDFKKPSKRKTSFQMVAVATIKCQEIPIP